MVNGRGGDGGQGGQGGQGTAAPLFLTWNGGIGYTGGAGGNGAVGGDGTGYISKVDVGGVIEGVVYGGIGGVRHFLCHTGDGFVIGNHQAGEVVGEMFALGSVVKQWCEKLVEGVLHDVRGCNNGHRELLFQKNFFRSHLDSNETLLYNTKSNFVKV